MMSWEQGWADEKGEGVVVHECGTDIWQCSRFGVGAGDGASPKAIARPLQDTLEPRIERMARFGNVLGCRLLDILLRTPRGDRSVDRLADLHVGTPCRPVRGSSRGGRSPGTPKGLESIGVQLGESLPRRYVTVMG